jgi:hypothetical protein
MSGRGKGGKGMDSKESAAYKSRMRHREEEEEEKNEDSKKMRGEEDDEEQNEEEDDDEDKDSDDEEDKDDDDEEPTIKIVQTLADGKYVIADVPSEQFDSDYGDSERIQVVLASEKAQKEFDTPRKLLETMTKEQIMEVKAYAFDCLMSAIRDSGNEESMYFRYIGMDMDESASHFNEIE